MSDWVFENFGWLILGFLCLFIGMLVFAFHENGIDEANFMAECLQDHKHYKCEEKWRAGESHITPVAVPMVIPMNR